MTRFLPAILLAACLILGYCYGRERAGAAKQDAKITALLGAADSLARHGDSVAVLYHQARLQAAAADTRARARVVYRDRAVASTDSVLARALNVASAVPASDTTPTTDCRKAVSETVASLQSAIHTERLASDSAIASLSSALSLKDVALASADSLIASLGSRLRVANDLVSEYEKQAHPSLAIRTGRFLRHAAIGAAVTVVLLVVK